MPGDMKEIIKQLIKKVPFPLTKNHRYDLQTKKIIRSLPADGNCIDVGCYKGEILKLMIKAAPKGHHFGFEPIPDLFEELKKKFNGYHNVTLLNVAASNAAGQSDFNFVTSNPSYSGLKKRDYDKPNEKARTIRVRTGRIDDLVPEDLRIDLIKIDVEGAELFVLEGASRIISDFRPLVIFEHGLGASNHYNTTPEKVFSFFAERGMSVSNLGGFLKGRESLGEKEFEAQYHAQEHYYFIAHK
jgi:FkbM family methyltransferase